jgi:hypothetical protein
MAAVLQDILGHGNSESGAVLPGQGKHAAAQRSAAAGGLVFTASEVVELAAIARACGAPFDPAGLARV